MIVVQRLQVFALIPLFKLFNVIHADRLSQDYNEQLDGGAIGVN
jgi:hypothetical protein